MWLPTLPLTSWVILDMLVIPYLVSVAQVSLIPQTCGSHRNTSQIAQIGHEQSGIDHFDPLHKPTVLATV